MKDPNDIDSGTSAAPAAHGEGLGQNDHFLRLMFFQPSHATGGRHPRPRLDRPPGQYSPLQQARAAPGAAYRLPDRATATRVTLDSPALEVMTDLRRVEAVTIGRLALIDEANQAMITHGVRALFVVDEARNVVGVITATDILGERPVQLTHQRGIRHDEIIVRDVMTPAERLEVTDVEEVRYARVGDVVSSLRLSGRQHALVVEAGAAGSEHTVRGIFSLTQIARQLGFPAQPLHDIGRTFAEIESAIAAR